eukprot:m.570068 g.570068  ORF g.570068 m.570068 type:complete len:443 (-) comp57848_c0_seq4:160-1488(-)
MSDDDFLADDGSDQSFGFEYESEGSEDSVVDAENQYYTAKQLRETSAAQALAAFQKVIECETPKGEWGFRAHKQMMKLHNKAGNYTAMIETYRGLLTYIKSAVTRNYSERSINTILDRISSSDNHELLQSFYETTLDALKEAKNDRLWFKTTLKLGKMHLDREEFTKLLRIIKHLYASCQGTEESDEVQRTGTQLLEVYALEIQMYTIQKNAKKLKALYERSLQVKSAIPHPFIMGIIRECGGKMHLREEQWGKAYQDFFEAFKNYDESGSSKKITCLKYLVLANMLMKSTVDPFEAQESKPYRNDPQILALTNLVRAYQANDINEFERIIHQHRQSIMDDSFVREYIQDLLRNVRTEALVKVLKPYSRVRLSYLAHRLNVSLPELRQLLITSILDGLIDGRVDEIEQVVVVERRPSSSKYETITALTSHLNGVAAQVSEKL